MKLKFVICCLVISGLFIGMEINELWPMAKEPVEEISEDNIIENKICPVCGGLVQEEMRVQCKHKDKLCFVCSSACAENLRKDPDRYFRKLEELQRKQERRLEREYERSQEKEDLRQEKLEQ